MKVYVDLLIFQSIPGGQLVVDLGCGNGKYLGLDAANPRYEIGGDFSLNLLRILANRGLEGHDDWNFYFP